MDLGAPRAASARPPRPGRPARPTCARPPGPQRHGDGRSRRDAGPRRPADMLLCGPPAFVRLALHTHRRHRPPGARRHEPTPPDAKNEAQAFLVKADFIGRQGRPARAARSPARPPGRSPAETPRAAGPALPCRPPPPRRRGPRTAHRLPRRRLQRRRPAPECGPGPGRRISLPWHRGGREPRESRRRRWRADVTRRGQPARAGAAPSTPIREEPG